MNTPIIILILVVGVFFCVNQRESIRECSN